jgi:hypothetical protein
VRGPFRASDGTQQGRIRPLREREGLGRQRLARRIDGGAAQQARHEFKGVAETCLYGAKDAHRLGGYLAADAVAGKNRDQRLHQERAAS